MRFPVITVAALLAGGSGGCMGGGCNSDPFPDDSCDQPGSAGLTSLEIGTGEGADFAPLSEGAVRPIAYGSQGGEMVTLTLGMRGPQVPACMQQSTGLYTLRDDDLVGSDGYPKQTYAQADGLYTTRYIYIQYEDWLVTAGDGLRVRAMAGGQSDEVLIYLEFVGTPDAGPPDGGLPDAGPDAGGVDAMIDAG